MTMGSFNPVTVDPPLALFSLGRRSKSLPSMLDADGFVVKVARHATHPDAPAPLMFFRGGYRDLVDNSQHEPAWPLPIHY